MKPRVAQFKQICKISVKKWLSHASISCPIMQRITRFSVTGLEKEGWQLIRKYSVLTSQLSRRTISGKYNSFIYFKHSF